jgi:glycine/D-amino acid oxidase-like deaminating enzyme
LPDKRPVAGWHPERTRLGVLGGLGAKGVLLAPWLARVWVEALAGCEGGWPTEVAVGRGLGI